MDYLPLSDFPLEQFKAFPVEEQELCLAVVRADIAELELQKLGGKRPPAND